MHGHDGHDHEEEAIEAVEQQDGFGVEHARTIGQHLYFKVYGETSDEAFRIARDAGIKVLDVRRLREQPQLVTEQVELGPDDEGYEFDPKDPTRKMMVDVVLEKQPPIYRAIQTDDFEQDDQRRKRCRIETLIEDAFTFVVKGMAPRAA